ncbi:hypothetical protein [Pleurocapsa sp. CCALA 161]|uniref:hypothetical protein n=1 Tax=Pleurocapsa sp. CCALA 161 TaxID=2107688 RepID=UPI001E614BEF|nr:hypothetical protein [Pleurocapsa sp. CCALA 161]
MSLIRKFFLPYLKIALINIAILAASSVHVKAEQIKLSSPSNFRQPNNSKLSKTQLQPIPLKEKLNNAVAAQPLEDGAPSLRRQPSAGERFEPKRIPLQLPFPKETYRTSPSITIINPSAYGAAWGNVGIGIGYQERARFREDADGVIGLGFGLGDPQKNLGLQVGVSLVDVSSPFSDGSINLKLHRRLPKDFAVAIGVQGLTTWGNTDGGSSVYGVATKRFKLRPDRTKPFSELYTTLGVGGGQFRSESNINEGNENVGVFGSLAVKVIQPIGLVAEWSGQDLTIGVPLVPFRKLPLVIVPSITDVTGSAGDGTRFVLGLGYSFSFK